MATAFQLTLVPLEGCPACGAAGGRRTGVESGDIALLRCESCGLVHANGHYERSFLADDFYAERAEGSRAAGDRNTLARRRRAFQRFDRLSGGRLAHPPPGARALDVGCLTGVLLDVVQSHGYETHGIERSRAAAAIASQRHRIHAIDLESEEIGELPSDFALITFQQVLEHLRRPVDALRWAKGRLAKDGCIVVEVPNWDDAARRLWGARYRPLELGDHLSFFDRDSLAMAANRAGLRVAVMWSAPEGATAVLPSVVTALDVAKSLRARARGKAAGVAGTRIDAGAAPGKLKSRVLGALDRLDPLLAKVAGDARWGANLVAILRPA